MKNTIKNNSGFTLVELMVVVVILGILIAIAIPRVVGVVEGARLATDQSTVRTLNAITQVFRFNHPSPDPFMDNSKSSADLLRLLLENGYLAAEVEPQTKDAVFTWLSDKDKWYLMFADSFYVITLADGFTLHNGRLSGSYSGGSKDVVIPASIDGLGVREIYQDTFRNKGMIAVNFDGNSQVQRIHARAFLDNNLTSIDLPDSLERIDLWSFRNNNLTEITLPPDLHTIEQRAFDGNDLTRITIGANVTVIQDRALGEHTDKFKQAYEANGAGTYIWDGANWVKQGP